MDAVVEAAQADGHILVDFHNDGLGTLANGLHVRAAGAEVEVAVLIHGRHLKHGNIQALDAVAVIAGQFGITQGDIERETILNGLALNTGHVPGVPGKVIGSVGNIKNGRPAGQDTTPDIDVRQLLHAVCQSLVQRVGGADAPAVVQPVAGLNNLDSFFSRSQLLLVFFQITHVSSSRSDLLYDEITHSHTSYCQDYNRYKQTMQ